MANRTTATEVKKIMATGLIDADVTNVIDFANRQVTVVFSGSTLSAAVLKDIESWLTAHLIAMGKERQAEKEKVEGISELWFQKKTGESLRSTTYGQMVIMLDSSGLMIEAAKQKTKIRAIKQVNT